MLCGHRAQFVFQQFEQIIHVPICDVPLVGVKIPIPKFTEQTLKLLCAEFTSVQRGSPSIAQLQCFFPGNVVVVGDLSGNLHNLIAIFSVFGLPPFQQYTFLGDFISEGNMDDFSLEVYILLMSLKCVFPNHITLLRGKNESIAIQTINNGMKAQIFERYSKELFSSIINTFAYLPIAMISDQDECFFGNASSMKVFSSIIKSYKNLDELKENCLHLLPASYIKDDDQIKENDVKEFLNTTDFEKVFIGGSTCIKDDSEKIFPITSSAGNEQISIVMIKEEQIDETTFMSPPVFTRKEALFAREYHEMKGKNRINTLHEIVKPRIQPQRGYFNLNRLPAFINKRFSV